MECVSERERERGEEERQGKGKRKGGGKRKKEKGRSEGEQKKEGTARKKETLSARPGWDSTARQISTRPARRALELCRAGEVWEAGKLDGRRFGWWMEGREQMKTEGGRGRAGKSRGKQGRVGKGREEQGRAGKSREEQGRAEKE